MVLDLGCFPARACVNQGVRGGRAAGRFRDGCTRRTCPAIATVPTNQSQQGNERHRQGECYLVLGIDPRVTQSEARRCSRRVIAYSSILPVQQGVSLTFTNPQVYHYSGERHLEGGTLRVNTFPHGTSRHAGSGDRSKFTGQTETAEPKVLLAEVPTG